MFSEFINSIYFTRYWKGFIMFLYTFLVIFFDWYKEWTICLIAINKFPKLLSVFIYDGAIGNLWSIWLGVNILSPVPLVALVFASDIIKESS